MGTTLGLCAVCQVPGAIHTCTACGRLVCGRHFQRGTGVCTAHATGGAGGAAGLGPPHGRT